MDVFYNNFFSGDMTDKQMVAHVEAMDGQVQELLSIAMELRAKLQKCTTHTEVQAVMARVKPLLDDTKQGVKEL